MTGSFKCAACGEEAAAEPDSAFPGFTEEECALVCDDCYKCIELSSEAETAVLRHQRDASEAAGDMFKKLIVQPLLEDMIFKPLMKQIFEGDGAPLAGGPAGGQAARAGEAGPLPIREQTPRKVERIARKKLNAPRTDRG